MSTNIQKVFLLEGRPGTGKTSLAEYIANILDAHKLYYLCHQWTTNEELLYSVDLNKLAQSKIKPIENVYKEGIIIKTIKLSHYNKIVLILDELDKANENIDALLLDFLENWRAHDENDEELRANKENVIVFMTSNQNREIIDPLKRRAFRVQLEYLPENIEGDLILNQDTYYLDNLRKLIVRVCKNEIIYSDLKYKSAIAKLLTRLANRLRKEENDVSLSEMRNAYMYLHYANSFEDVMHILIGWYLKERNEYLLNIVYKYATQIWGVIK